eukprot:3647012-Pleurochrysis_carterae.AAC.1
MLWKLYLECRMGHKNPPMMPCVPSFGLVPRVLLLFHCPGSATYVHTCFGFYDPKKSGEKEGQNVEPAAVHTKRTLLVPSCCPRVNDNSTRKNAVGKLQAHGISPQDFTADANAARGHKMHMEYKCNGQKPT